MKGLRTIPELFFRLRDVRLAGNSFKLIHAARGCDVWSQAPTLVRKLMGDAARNRHPT
jgi:hypothetical protein